MILSCSHITKAFPTRTVLSDASFHLEEREKAAIVGINGAGKSTLLKIIVGEMKPDEGDVTLSKGASFGYLAQQMELSSDQTIYDAVLEIKADIIALEKRLRSMEHDMKIVSGTELEALMESYAKATERFEQSGGYAWRSEVIGVLKGLGFSEEDYERPIRTLSGGQKTRVFLARLLLSRPDLLLLDEPTNHLDMNSIAWLETFLMNYPGAVLIVAHDRYFLDRVVTKVFEVENSRVETYRGNYSTYAEKKRQLFEARMREYMNQQAEIKHQEEVIEKLRSFNREKSIKRAESRVKALEKIEVLDRPQQIDASMHITLTPRRVSGNDVLHTEGLAKSFPGRPLFSDASLDVRRGERVAIIGDNGTGKTTLLKIITGSESADAGRMVLGTGVSVGYYDQEHQVLHPDKTLFEELSDAYPELTNTQVRNILAAFLFSGEDVFKQIRTLSGGERGRVSLAKLMLSECNFLILDEPTNHLDIQSREILENALVKYTGTVLFVSHDRYFINRTATRVLELSDGGFVSYPGNYDYVLEKKAQAAEVAAKAQAMSSSSLRSPAGPIVAAAKSPVSENRSQWEKQKEAQAKERKRLNDLKKVEERIEKLEAEKDAVTEKMSDPNVACNSHELMELSKKAEALAVELEEAYAQWELLAE